jgi:hypothetical protein
MGAMLARRAEADGSQIRAHGINEQALENHAAWMQR